MITGVLRNPGGIEVLTWCEYEVFACQTVVKIRIDVRITCDIFNRKIVISLPGCVIYNLPLLDLEVRIRNSNLGVIGAIIGGIHASKLCAGQPREQRRGRHRLIARHDPRCEAVGI